jgi:hypothetical protein
VRLHCRQEWRAAPYLPIRQMSRAPERWTPQRSRGAHLAWVPDVSHFRAVRDWRIGFSGRGGVGTGRIAEAKGRLRSRVWRGFQACPDPTRDFDDDGDREGKICASPGALLAGAAGRAPTAIRRTGRPRSAPRLIGALSSPDGCEIVYPPSTTVPFQSRSPAHTV